MKGTILFGLTGLVFLLPMIAFGAHDGGIVPCHGSECDWADLVSLGQNVLNLIVTLAVIVSAIMFAYAGMLFFSSSANASGLEKAKKIFAGVIIGLVIILTAWLIINTILETLTGRGLDKRVEDISTVPVDITQPIV